MDPIRHRIHIDGVAMHVSLLVLLHRIVSGYLGQE